ncbi:hypothetical protein TPB0596_08400 [Tsukamurella pulmonis]|uniref:Uncharacterized protein n=1 Tax=Tsukamurella pulmonis TaxID=47312 RepID=A0A1H1HB81_9ACTN|nr:hypothetical protein [Tsukamurella pulmonis]KXO94884.1 hypothetical protein AXK56_20005 [Tsukamurella pulmonis]KXP12908.1 hypothetical protein AXK57_01275 [Tsukamurella pulmonis]RDH11197.1 hypothetical protein DVB88_13940 [Tsukamurella pulmonis]SDR22631.1 hypothetical protein SAMN04489765_3991 [Tsukamurella pulmonis]SUP15355.1 Uncharacterised protein [Tsukamurella pulmonis]
MGGEAVVLVVVIGATLAPIALAVVVRRRQKSGRWRGGFTPGYDPTTDNWATRVNAPPPANPDQSEIRDRHEY